MASRPVSPHAVHIVDSHTEGEPTRVVVGGSPVLAGETLAEKLAYFRAHHDEFRTGVLLEPRGSEVLVGALLLEPEQRSSAAGVIFFNDVGYLGMCGHGIIGVVTTLAHLGRLQPGFHRIDTPVGTVATCLHPNGSVSVENVPSYRHLSGVQVQVPGLGTLTGDIAWGGNWFFLARQPVPLAAEHRSTLVAAAVATRNALAAEGITGRNGALIDHIEFLAPPHDPANSARNFVLCPGAAFDRSPCGTGTSAKLACLYADGLLTPGEVWRQEGILGTVFAGSIKPLLDADLAASDGLALAKSPMTSQVASQVLPTITGRAWITAEATLLFHADDPFSSGIAWR